MLCKVKAAFTQHNNAIFHDYAALITALIVGAVLPCTTAAPPWIRSPAGVLFTTSVRKFNYMGRFSLEVWFIIPNTQ